MPWVGIYYDDIRPAHPVCNDNVLGGSFEMRSHILKATSKSY